MKILKQINLPIILSSLLLVSIGILVIYSSSHQLALNQLIFTIFGIAIYLLVSQFELDLIKNLILPINVFIIILLIAVLILGVETRGALRWIPLGIFNVQPSEFAKPALILFLANFWSGNLPTWSNILKSLFWSSPFFFLVFKQPDLGSTLTLIAIWLGILLALHISVKKMMILFLIISLVIPSSWLFLHDYQKQRIVSFLTPGSDPLGKGYNLIQSTIAVGSGEFLGRGLGRGTQSRLQFLPEFRTDFIFASIAEEMGFVGSALILSLYLFLLSYCLSLARKAKIFGFLVAVGVVSGFIFQIFVNIGMNIGLLPITGITLPLISYGGSSLIVTFLSLALIISATKFKRGANVDHVHEN
ncbi:rod shape-determining protein RodA [Candidatus Daviesbacteria bacterium]|nr:rod shape-determining protein RodA [Candidatus Daviesbacteria bacterium]